MFTLCFRGLLCLFSIMWMSQALADTDKTFTKQYQDYKLRMSKALKQWSDEDKLRFKQLAIEKSQSLANVDKVMNAELKIIDDEYEENLIALRKTMMQKTTDLQRRTELSYIYAVKLQQEKFNKKKPILVKYNKEKLEIEKRHLQNVLKQKVESLTTKYELLNDEKPNFILEHENIETKDWARAKFCSVEKNYKYQDLWLNYLYVQYKNLTPLKVKLLEYAYQEDILKKTLESYQNSYNKLEILSAEMEIKPKSAEFLADKIMQTNMQLERTSSVYEEHRNKLANQKANLKKSFDTAKKTIACELDKSKIGISENWRSDKLVTYSGL